MSNCLVCGRQKSNNLDPLRCVLCFNEMLAWYSARNWLPLARARVDAMEAEITTLRAALDQERAKVRRLEFVVKSAIPSVDDYVRGRALIGGGTAEHHAKAALRMLRDALLSGRGEGEGNG